VGKDLHDQAFCSGSTGTIVRNKHMEKIEFATRNLNKIVLKTHLESAGVVGRVAQ